MQQLRSTEINLNLKTTPVFSEIYNTNKRIIVNRGGTRSSKTYSACQLLVLWLFTGQISATQRIETGIASIVRKSLPALKASAYRDIIEILHDLDLYKHVKEHKTDKTISFGPRMIEFFSADDQQKVRSRKRNILLCVEANELGFKSDFYQLAIRTTDKILIDFNPDDPDIWINTELEQKRAATKKDVEVIVSNYKWNPFLDEETIGEIEYTKQVDPELWQVYGKGEYGKITGLIYKNVTVIEDFPEDIKTLVYGLDFGFNDPMALVKVGVNDLDLYLDELYYKRNTIPSELIEELPGFGIGVKDYIYYDSSRPGSGKEIRNAGYRLARPSQKGQGSLIDGILKLKKYRWHVTARSQNLLSELRKYKWEVDNNGEVVENKPIDQYNHALDAVRYGVYTHLYKPVRTARFS